MSREEHTRPRAFWRLGQIVPTVVLYCLLVSLYLYVVPSLEGFDSIAHYNYVNYLGQRRKLPSLDNETAQVSYELVQQPPLYYMLSAIAALGSPFEEAHHFAVSSENPYLKQGLSQRWSVTLPEVPRGVGRSIWTARLISALGGLLAVVGTWLLVSELIPNRPSMATAVACIVGLNPLFLFVSSTITNDSWAVAGATITLWLVTRAAKSARFSALQWFVLGCVGGIASLAKYSVLLVAIPSLVVVLWHGKKFGLWRLGLAGLLVLAGALLTAGYWYLRNLALYGQLIPFEQMTIAIPTLLRPLPMTPAEIQEMLPWILHSFWGVFVGIFAPSSYYTLMHWFVIVGSLGLPVYLVVRRGPDKLSKLLLVFLCLAWISVTLVSMISWMSQVVFGEQARLLLTASPAIAILLVLGWQAFLPASWSSRLHLVLAVLFIFVAAWPLPTLARSYAMPESIDQPIVYDRGILATFDGGLTVLGIDLPQGAAVEQGAELPLTIYFRAENVIADHYTMFLHLVDNEQGLYGFDGVPFGGRHTTRQWIPGQAFADTYSILVDPEAQVEAETLAVLTLGFYDHPSKKRLGVYDAHGTPIGDRLELARIRILAEPPSVQAAPSPALAQWENGIRLVSVDAKEDIRDGSYSFILDWQTPSFIHQDYTVFLQALDADDQVVAQVDQQPGEGRLPTSTWLPGETIHDAYRLDLAFMNWARIVIGFYDHVTGKRLLLEQPSEGQDYFSVPVRVGD